MFYLPVCSPSSVIQLFRSFFGKFQIQYFGKGNFDLMSLYLKLCYTYGYQMVKNKLLLLFWAKLWKRCAFQAVLQIESIWPSFYRYKLPSFKVKWYILNMSATKIFAFLLFGFDIGKYHKKCSKNFIFLTIFLRYWQISQPKSKKIKILVALMNYIATKLVAILLLLTMSPKIENLIPGWVFKWVWICVGEHFNSSTRKWHRWYCSNTCRFRKLLMVFHF